MTNFKWIALFLAGVFSASIVSAQSSSYPISAQYEDVYGTRTRVIFGDNSLYRCASSELRQYTMGYVTGDGYDGLNEAVVFCGEQIVELYGELTVAQIEKFTQRGIYFYSDHVNSNQRVTLPPITVRSRIIASSAEDSQSQLKRETGSDIPPRDFLSVRFAGLLQAAPGGLGSDDIQKALADSFFLAPAFARARAAGIVAKDGKMVSVAAGGTGHRFLFEVNNVKCTPLSASLKRCSYSSRVGMQALLLNFPTDPVFLPWSSQTESFLVTKAGASSATMIKRMASFASSYASHASPPDSKDEPWQAEANSLKTRREINDWLCATASGPCGH